MTSRLQPRRIPKWAGAFNDASHWRLLFEGLKSQWTDAMSAQPDFNPTPSVEEFVGWYNIEADREDGLPVLRSVDAVPEFEHAEFFELHTEAEPWFSQLVEARASGPFDPLTQPPFSIRSDADDRTLDVDADFRHLNVALLRRIQREFLGRYPLWRVILIGEHPSCSIVIYPSAIRFGNRPVHVDPDRALQELVPRNLALKDARERPRREYIAQIQCLLADGVRAIGEAPFLVCGVLDNYAGDYSRMTICLLVRGADDYAVYVEGPPDADNHFLWKDSAFGVSNEGVIVSYIEVSAATPFCLVPWLPPADYRGPLTIIEHATGKRYSYHLTSESIIRTGVTRVDPES
jgi:hypothetical protein